MGQATESDVALYLAAKLYLRDSNFAAEADSLSVPAFGAFAEQDLLREAAWVILCSGFREAIVRRIFDFISLCFCDWESAAAICKHADQCRSTALSTFRSDKKVDAILSAATILNEIGFPRFKQNVLDAPISTLQTLPYIGPITAYHLAKNLGLGTAKPDRHLERLARNMGYAGTHQLCEFLAAATGDPVQLVDTVLWRCAEQQFPIIANYSRQDTA